MKMKFNDLELLMKTTENKQKKIIQDKRNDTTFFRNNIAIFK